MICIELVINDILDNFANKILIEKDYFSFRKTYHPGDFKVGLKRDETESRRRLDKTRDTDGNCIDHMLCGPRYP